MTTAKEKTIQVNQSQPLETQSSECGAPRSAVAVEGHTPTPWRLVGADDSPTEWSVRDGSDWRICTVHGYCSANPATVENEESEANAALIVNAVNSHATLVAERDALREALKSIWSMAEPNSKTEQIAANALALSTTKESE